MEGSNTEIVDSKAAEQVILMDVATKEVHLRFMREALAMAEYGLSIDETPVGCVFVYQNEIIAQGVNATNRTYNGTRHAEFMALSEILSPRTDGTPAYHPEILSQCDLYVTVEPCIMCASLLRQVGIRKVYYGASNDKFGGTGGVLNLQRANGAEPDEILTTHGDYEVSGGWMREEAILMLRRFYVQENERAPEPRNKKERVLKLEVDYIFGSEISGALI